ncbi:MAG TPA: hypothetical protein PKE04_03360, partial [Clostridia bacterium]|nr:hypothetical protein [Clostridia bacterium]
TLYPIFGLSGVALAMAISSSLSAIAMFVLLKHRVKDVGQKRVVACLGKTVVATGAMCLVLWLCMRAFSLMAVGGMRLLMLMGGAVGAALLVYLLVLLILRTEELRMLLALFRKKSKGARSEGANV